MRSKGHWPDDDSSTNLQQWWSKSTHKQIGIQAGSQVQCLTLLFTHKQNKGEQTMNEQNPESPWPFEASESFEAQKTAFYTLYNELWPFRESMLDAMRRGGHTEETCKDISYELEIEDQEREYWFDQVDQVTLV